MLEILMYVNCVMALINLVLIEISMNLNIPLTPNHGLIWTIAAFTLNFISVTFLFIQASKKAKVVIVERNKNE